MIQALLIVTCAISSSLLPLPYLIFPEGSDPPHYLFFYSYLDLKVQSGQNGAMQVPGHICSLLFPLTKVLGCRPYGHFRDSTLLHNFVEQNCQPSPLQRVQGSPAHRPPARPLPTNPHPTAHSAHALLGHASPGSNWLCASQQIHLLAVSGLAL